VNSYRNPKATWIPANSNNFTPDRAGHDTSPPFYIVLHTTVGSWQSAVAAFQNPNRGASAHYIVRLDGTVIQMVDEKDAAWHAGNYGVNLDSIGIEHEDNGDYNGLRTDALYEASANLIADISRRYGITITWNVIKLHKQVSDAPTACPDALNTNHIYDLVLAKLHPAPPVVVPPPAVDPRDAQIAKLLVEITGLKAQVAQEMALRTSLAQKLVQIRDIANTP
jgi:N-acetylmuramoyl-L-alanine amidase CwlA